MDAAELWVTITYPAAAQSVEAVTSRGNPIPDDNVPSVREVKLDPNLIDICMVGVPVTVEAIVPPHVSSNVHLTVVPPETGFGVNS